MITKIALTSFLLMSASVILSAFTHKGRIIKKLHVVAWLFGACFFVSIIAIIWMP